MSSDLVDINRSKLSHFITQNIIKDNECEIRVGTFTNGRFESNIDIKFFYDLKNKLDDAAKQQNNPVIPIYTKEIKYGENIREINHSLNENFSDFISTNYITKNTLNNIDIKEYNIRFSISKEQTVNTKPVTLPEFYRYKTRYSYPIPFGKFDLTIVYQGKIDNIILEQLPIYEIEFELSKEINVENEMLLKIITFMLQVRQSNSFVINENEKYNIINEYKSLTKQNFFIGAQPQTLHKDDLSKLYQELYSVTDKADGIRYFLFINKHKNVYLIDNNLKNVIKTDVQNTTYFNCLIDGELINEKDDKKSFYTFDILFFNNQDLRGNLKYCLKERLNELKNTVDTMSTSILFSINIKQFIYRNVFLGSDIIMKNINDKNYNNDGLIFTPINKPYPIKGGSWPYLLKWKQPSQNTIDFYSIKKSSLNGIGTWELYVVKYIKDPIIQNRLTHEKELFDTNKLCPEVNTTVITYITSFKDILLDEITNKNYLTNTVIEYKWDDLENKFIPIRTRWNKTIGGSNKHGNASHVACDIWKTINNPVLLNDIIKMTNTSTIMVKSNINKSPVDDFFFLKTN